MRRAALILMGGAGRQIANSFHVRPRIRRKKGASFHETCSIFQEAISIFLSTSSEKNLNPNDQFHTPLLQSCSSSFPEKDFVFQNSQKYNLSPA